MLIPAALLSAIGVRATPGAWSGPLSNAMAAQGISTPPRIALFLANVLNETGMLSRLTESLDYTPHALLSQWPQHFGPTEAEALGRSDAHPADQEGIAELAYGGRLGNRAPGAGDGWLFRGHGALQTTGRSNMLDFARAISWRDPVEALPPYLETVTGACQSAALFFQAHGCNALADQGDIAGVRRRVNGSTIGLGVVTALHHTILLAMRGGAVPAAPPVLVQPKTVTPLAPTTQDGIERVQTEALNQQSLTDALNARR